MVSGRARLASFAFLVVSALIPTASCGDDDPGDGGGATLTIAEGCNPIAAEAGDTASDCLLPYPSDFFRTPQGVVIPPAAQPLSKGAPIDLLAPHRPDGFSVGATILALFPGGVDASSLVFHTGDIDASTTDASPTTIVDAETGERVLHFAELDPRAADDAHRALILRPVKRLENAHRYIVAIHDLKDAAGAVIAAPAGFASLRDAHGKASPALEALSDHYETDVFASLEAAGVHRASLQLAWDFTTASEAQTTGDLLAIQADLVPKLAASAPSVHVTNVVDAPSEHIGRRIDATVTVPLYLDASEPGGHLHYDATGHVSENGTVEVPFSLWIPTSVMKRPKGSPPARLMQFGHGFFGTRDEVEGLPIELADEKGFVIFAADWWGFSEPDRLFLANQIVTDLGSLPYLSDRAHQAMANFMAVAAAVKGPMFGLSATQLGGEPAYDPSEVYFYGISMGHILGSTYVTLSPDVHKAALAVGGSDLGLMLFRSQAFVPLLILISLDIAEPLEQQKLAAELQSSLDRIDNLSYLPHMLVGRYPLSSSSLTIAMQTGLGDASVPNLASFLQARTLGLPVLQPSPAAPYGLEPTDSPAEGSALTLFDFGVTPDDLAESPAGNDVHEGVRRSEGSKAQIDRFFRPLGKVEQACSDVCDPD